MDRPYRDHIYLPELEKYERYAAAHTSPEPPALRALADQTRELSRASQMLVGQIEGRLLTLLFPLLRPRSVPKIGT